MPASMKRPITLVPGMITPKVGLLNPAFVYINAANTDIRQTFDRIRAEQAGK